MYRCKTNFCTFYDKKVCCSVCPRQEECAFKCKQFFETCGKAIKDARIAFVPKEIPKVKYRRKKYGRKKLYRVNKRG